MPPLPGEERIQTVFADVHCYFIAPTPRPLHHRFDKGSYFYVYQDAALHTARLEIANNPGTTEQDAFHGSLDRVHLKYSYKFPTLLTLVVDPVDSTSPAPASPAKDAEEWRLASSDPRDQGQYKYRLHTLDIYFWTLEDASGVIEAMKRILRPQQLDILDAPRTSTHGQDGMSPVVQQLEKIAITDPAYRNGQTRNSQNKLVTLPPQSSSTISTSGYSPLSQNDPATRSVSVKSSEASANFAPLAYNPAAPAAPEPISHREKTPPPADAGNGTGLAAAAYADHTQAHAGIYPQTYGGVPGQPPPPPPAGHYGSPPPSQPGARHYGSPTRQPGSIPYGSQALQSAYAPPLSGQNLHHIPPVTSNTSTYRTSMTSPHAAPPSSTTSPLGRQPSLSQPGSYAPPPQDPSAHLYSAPTGANSPPSFAPTPPPQPPQPDPNHTHPYNTQPQSHVHPQSPPVESPGAQIYGTTPRPHQPLPHLQPQYPDYLQSRPAPQPQPRLGGYAQYSYDANPAASPPSHPHHETNNTFNVHNQLYRPTEEEDRKKQKHGKGQPGRFEETAGKVDKKVGSLFKRLEKRL